MFVRCSCFVHTPSLPLRRAQKPRERLRGRLPYSLLMAVLPDLPVATYSKNLSRILEDLHDDPPKILQYPGRDLHNSCWNFKDPGQDLKDHQRF